ncbi:MAG: hypothetical protein K2Y08_07150 [Alphaproteobacteria bacterium]|nr:hypothetical protein [Alphaproteobacteria bacterium]
MSSDSPNLPEEDNRINAPHSLVKTEKIDPPLPLPDREEIAPRVPLPTMEEVEPHLPPPIMEEIDLPLPLHGIEESHLYSFIEKYLVKQEDISESKPKKILRIGAQVLGGVFGSLAGIPYFTTAQNSAGGNIGGGWVIGIINTVSISGTGAWSYFTLLKGLNPQSKEEKALIKKSKLLIPLHITSHVLGVVSSVPNSYIIYLYNTQKWFVGITGLYDYSLGTNGYLSLFKKVIAHKCKTRCCCCRKTKPDDLEVAPPTLNTQKFLTRHLLDKTIPALLTLSIDERDQFITSLYHNDNLKVENYLESLLNLPYHLPIATPATWKKGYPKIVFISGLSLSAVFNLFHNGFCSYKTWQMIYNSPYFVIPMTIVSTVPLFLLEINATIVVGSSLYDSAFYIISRKPMPPSLLHTLYPKTSRVLPFACIPLAAVTAYVGRYLVSNILLEILPNDAPRLALVIGGFLGPFFFSAYTNYSLVQDLLLKYARSFGDITKKKFVRLIQELEELSKMIGLTKKEEIKKFTDHPNIQNSIFILNIENGHPIQAPKLRKRIQCGIM